MKAHHGQLYFTKRTMKGLIVSEPGEDAQTAAIDGQLGGVVTPL